jgi:hypothetical protein
MAGSSGSLGGKSAGGAVKGRAPISKSAAQSAGLAASKVVPIPVPWAEALSRGADMPPSATMVGNVNINSLPLDRDLMTKQYNEKFGGVDGKYDLITSTNLSGKAVYLIVPKR